MESRNDSATGLPSPPPQLPPINFPEEPSGNDGKHKHCERIVAPNLFTSKSRQPSGGHGLPRTGITRNRKRADCAGVESECIQWNPAPLRIRLSLLVREKAPGAFGASITTDTGFPSVVVTPVPSSNTETARGPSQTVAPQPTPEALSHISQSRTSPVSTARPTVETPAQPKIGASTSGGQRGLPLQSRVHRRISPMRRRVQPSRQRRFYVKLQPSSLTRNPWRRQRHNHRPRLCPQSADRDPDRVACQSQQFSLPRNQEGKQPHRGAQELLLQPRVRLRIKLRRGSPHQYQMAKQNHRV